MYTHHAILILPAEAKGPGNALAAAMGWGDDNFTIPCTSRPEGDDTPTHLAGCGPVSAGFVELLAGARQGVAPEHVPPELLDVLAAIADDIEDASLRAPLEHLDAAFAARGLRRIA